MEEGLNGGLDGPIEELVCKIDSECGYGCSLLEVQNLEDESVDRVLLLSSWDLLRSTGKDIAGSDVHSTWRKLDSIG